MSSPKPNYEEILRKTYHAFNKRDIDTALAAMHPDVDWPNGMEGGIEHGPKAIRDYWVRQWKLYDPHVEPTHFEIDNNGNVTVTVHQVVRDMNKNVLVDHIIWHVYRFKEGLIKSMEIKNF